MNSRKKISERSRAAVRHAGLTVDDAPTRQRKNFQEGLVMDFGGKKISREVLEKLAKCQSEEEVIALAKENGVEIR